MIYITWYDLNDKKVKLKEFPTWEQGFEFAINLENAYSIGISNDKPDEEFLKAKEKLCAIKVKEWFEEW